MSDKVTYDKLEDPFPKYKWPVSLGKVIDFRPMKFGEQFQCQEI